jgi:hypothetical protein
VCARAGTGETGYRLSVLHAAAAYAACSAVALCADGCVQRQQWCAVRKLLVALELSQARGLSACRCTFCAGPCMAERAAAAAAVCVVLFCRVDVRDELVAVVVVASVRTGILLTTGCGSDTVLMYSLGCLRMLRAVFVRLMAESLPGGMPSPPTSDCQGCM